MLAGLIAPQLTSFATPGGLIPLASVAAVVAFATGRSTILLLFVAGTAMFVGEAESVIDRRMSQEFVGDSIMTTVRVADFPQERDSIVTFEGEVSDSPWVPRRIRVTWQEPLQKLRLGDLWHLELRLKRPRGTSNPGAFDYERWLFRKRIAAVAFVVDGGRNRLISQREYGPIDRLRQAAVDRLFEVVPDGDRAAILAAISVGTRHLVSPARWERYARTGTSHLMAISGLHVGMVGAVMYLLTVAVTAALGVSRHQHRIASLAALAAACTYATVSGFAVPAQRATIMIGLASVAIAVRRPVDSFRVLAVTSAVVAVADPLATLSPGFVLSFLAVLLLVWLAARRAPGHGRRLEAARLFRVQWALLLGLMPATILLFDRVAIMAPVVNLLAVPVFGTITVPLTLSGLLLDGPLRTAGNLFLGIASASLGFVERVIDVCLALPIADTRVPAVRGWRHFLIWTPVIWIVLPAGWPGRAAAWVAALALVTMEPARPEPGCADIEVIDVGQGLAVSIVTNSSSLLFDTGPAYLSGKSAASNLVLPYLGRLGVRALDHLVVSHGDLDHAGGVPAVVDHLFVRKIHAGDEWAGPRVASPCVDGQAFVHDRIRFEFLHPGTSQAWTGNDASCVLQVSAGSRRLLLTGDIEKAAEARLIRSGRLLPADVVIVPHHGSRTSSTPLFIEALRPAFAIVSAGYGNRWGQPDAAVVARWTAAGAELLNTATSGAVSFTLCEQGLSEPVAHRINSRRIWHE